MKVRQARLDRILGVYKPECRYLKETELIHPRFMHGRFEIPSSAYIENIGHLNATELFICYNQLAYAFLDERSLIQDEVSCQDMDISELREMQLHKCLICSADKIRFNREIDSRSFEGHIEVKNIRLNKGNTFYKTSYYFGDGAATGDILLVKLH